MRHDIVDFIRGKFPLFLLPSFLHEGMHHWCFASPLGATTSLIWLRAQRASLVPLGDDEGAWDVVDDAIRYQTVLRILRPLAEGMALFAEYDLVPSTSEIAPPYFTYGSIMFTNDGARQEGFSMVEADERFRQLLLRFRLTEGLKAKASLLVQDLSTAEGGYLPGYLVVRLIWIALSQIDDRMQQGPFFISFLRSYFYDDLGFLGSLLDPELHDIRIVQAVFDDFQAKLAKLFGITASDIDQFERYFLIGQVEASGIDPKLFPDFGRSVEEKEKGARLSRALASEAEDIDNKPYGVAALKWFHADLVNRRHLFRIGSTPVWIEVSDGHFKCFADEQHVAERRPFLSAPSTGSHPSDPFEGHLEFWFSNYANVSFGLAKRIDEVVGILSLGSGPEREASAQAHAASVAFDFGPTRAKLDAAVESRIDECGGRVVVDAVLAQLDQTVDLKYRTISCPASPAKEKVVSAMRRRGFFSVLDKDPGLVTLLALYSTAFSNAIACSQETLEDMGLARPGLANDLERHLLASNMDLLRGVAPAMVSLRV